MPKPIKGLSWFNRDQLLKLPHNEFLGELDWVNDNITDPLYSPTQIQRMKNYRVILEEDYRRRKVNRWS
jgi:hypothetical protein